MGFEHVPQPMTLAQAKEVRESLIESLVLASAESDAAGGLSSQQTQDLATDLADDLIASGWVTTAPKGDDEA